MMFYKTYTFPVWQVVHPDTKIITREDFKHATFKIDGVVYTKYSEKFKKAVNASLMWEKLRD